MLKINNLSRAGSLRRISGRFKNFTSHASVLILKFVLLILLFLISEIYAQPKSNLDVFYILVDSSANDFILHLPESKDSIKLEMNLGDTYSIFNNKVLTNLYSHGKILTENKNAVSLNYVIDNAKVVYGEIFRDGFFGDYYISRTVLLKGNYLIRNNSSFFQEYNFSFNDSIKYVEIGFVENESFNFTRGNIPSEPFFSGLFEPIVAIGTAALAVVLFFTIRSK